MRAEGFVPHATKVAAALSAAVTTTQHLGDQPHSHGRTSPKENQAYSQLLFGKVFGGGASLREAASPGTLAQSKVAAALSAAVTITNLQETAPNSHGDASWEEKSSLFPAALRERGSGGEGLLSEKPPLPQRSPQKRHVFREGSAREGTFLQKRPLPRPPLTIKELL